MKLCALCTHFRFEAGDPGYSEMTPGWDAVLMCRKGRWHVEMYETTEAELRDILANRARTCPDFSRVTTGAVT